MSISVSQFQALPHNTALAILAAITERLMPDYEAWCKRIKTYPVYVGRYRRQVSEGSPRLFAAIVDEIWTHIYRNHLTSSKIKELMDEIRPFLPDADDPDPDGNPGADCAAQALYSTLCTCVDENSPKATEPIELNMHKWLDPEQLSAAQTRTEWMKADIEAFRFACLRDLSQIDWTAWEDECDE